MWETLCYSSLSYDLDNGSLGSTSMSNCNSKKPFASQGHRLIMSLKFSAQRTQVGSKRARSPNAVTADGVLGENHLPNSIVLCLRVTADFYQKDNLLILLAIVSSPSISALTDQFLINALKHSMIETTHRSYLNWAKITCYD